METTATRPLTADDLLAMDSPGLELVDGELVELSVGAEASWIAGELTRCLGDFVVSRNLGHVFPADPSAAFSATGYVVAGGL